MIWQDLPERCAAALGRLAQIAAGVTAGLALRAWECLTRSWLATEFSVTADRGPSPASLAAVAVDPSTPRPASARSGRDGARRIGSGSVRICREGSNPRARSATAARWKSASGAPGFGRLQSQTVSPDGRAVRAERGRNRSQRRSGGPRTEVLAGRQEPRHRQFRLSSQRGIDRDVRH